MNIGERITHLRKEKKLTQSQLAKLVGLSQQAIQWLEKGKSKKTSHIIELAAALEVTPEWLQSGISPLQSASGYISMPPPLKPVGKIPVLMWDEVLKLKFDGKRYHMDVAVLDNSNRQYEVVYEQYPPNSFALPVEGDSMSSPYPGVMSFKEGMRLYVDIDSTPDSGDYVIATLHGNKNSVFRQYMVEGGAEYLKPLNPQYPLIQIDGSTHIIGVVIECKTRLK